MLRTSTIKKTEKGGISARGVGIFAFNVLISLALLEGLFAGLLAKPSLLKGFGNVKAFREYYTLFDRKIIQYEPDCARYDPEITYTLKPGQCEFSNREFKTRFSINSLGLRDDEASLTAPEIIVAGDSLAMGWGVNRDEAFAQILERETGLSVLNAAVSSYGTLREMRTLDRINISKLRYLIIQYNPNDYEENKYFYECGNQFMAMPQEEYEGIAREYRRLRRYYFGKHTLGMIRILSGRALPYQNSEGHKRSCPQGGHSRVATEDEASLFLNALMNGSHTDLNPVQIIVIGLKGANPFCSLLQKHKVSGDYPSFVHRLTLLDLSSAIKPEGYYFLDGHLNPRGHQMVADAILKILAPRLLPEK